MKHKPTNILRLTNTARQKIQKENLFCSQHNLLIAFSGGQDSAFCVLLFYLLRNKSFTWNKKKQVSLLKQYQIEKKLFTYKNKKNNVFFVKQFVSLMQNKIRLCDTFNLDLDIKNKDSTTKPVLHKFNVNLYQNQKVKQKNNVFLYNNVGLINNCVLLWCNHFWQKDSFFTMEHVLKFSFCKNYAMHLFVPIKKVLSELRARHWRHKVMQRLALFLRQKKCRYTSVELYLHPVTVTRSLLVRSLEMKNDLGYDLSEKRPKRKTKPGFELLCVQGHNKSDRAETILFNVIKGTGMNGISTLQWKHTFPPSLNDNNTFYPIFSDFFKEIQIVSLNSLLFQISYKKKKEQIIQAFNVNAFTYKDSTKWQLNFIRLVKTHLKFTSILQMFLPCTIKQEKDVASLNSVWVQRSFAVEQTKKLLCGLKTMQKQSENKTYKKEVYIQPKVKTFYYQLKYKIKTN